MFKKITLIAFIWLGILLSVASAQTDSLVLNRNIKTLQQYSSKYPAEKIHLHLDRQTYAPGDTIWFKAYAVSGLYHQLSTISGVLYAELINDRDSITERLTLPLDTGTSSGSFVIPAVYTHSFYKLRAYTNYMRNDDAAYFYEQKITLTGTLPVAITTKGKPVIVVGVAATKSTQPDIQFFPEGGELVDGLRSKVAVKAVNINGSPLALQGVVNDSDGNEVATFDTQQSGNGQFPVTPQKDKQYKAKITLADGTGFTLDLPKAKETGFTLSINSIGDSLFVKVAANDDLYKTIKGSKFYLLAQSAGKYYFAASSRLENPVFTARILKKRFPSGIVQFTLFSQSGEPLNERLIFIQNPDQLKLSVSTVKQTYSAKEKISIALAAKGEDDSPAAGTFSIGVSNETDAAVNESVENTIFSDLLLTSDLKGHIDNPNYYFANPNDKTRADLDLLMLTQGFRKFEWKKVLADSTKAINFPPQAGLSLSGTVKTPSGKPVPVARVKLTSILARLSADTVADANGDFTFNNVELSDTTKVVINAKDVDGSNNVKIVVKEPDYPVIPKTILTVNSTAYGETAISATQQPNKTDSLKRVIQLSEVKINHKKNPVFEPTYTDNIRFSSNLNGPGNANQVLLGDKLMACPTLPDCLRGKLFGVTISADGTPYSTRASTRHIGAARPMAVFIDGSQVGPADLNNLNGEEVYSIEVLTSVAYLSIYGSNAPNGALIITRRRGSNVFANNDEKPDGLITYKFNGYAKVRQFYTPQYNQPNAAQTPDDRKTIYWNPNIVTGLDGKSTIEFFNGGKGTYRVVVEGVDVDGTLGRQVYRYKVE